MEIQEKQDVEDLEQSLSYAETFFKIHTPLYVGHQIGECLVRKTLEIVKLNPSDQSHYYFSNPEIYEMLNSGKDSETARRWIKSHEDKLLELFSQTSSLNIELTNNGLSQISIERIASKGGRPVQWRVRTGNRFVKSVMTKLSTDIRYVVTEIHDPLPWAKPFMNAVLSPTKLLLTAISLLTVIVIPLYMFIGVIDWPSKEMATTFVILGIFGLLIFLKFHELLNKGVTEYPVFWSKSLTRNKLFLSTPTGSKGSPLGIKAVSIEASCPICGADILIEKSREFHNRYIGKCRIAPSEHVFSFDHVKKSGKFMR